MKHPVIKWTTIVEWYDITNGEQITKHKAKNYLVVKTEKQTTFNTNRTMGYVKITKLCTPNPQIKLL